MRQRKVKNLEERMNSHKRFFVADAQELKGKWRSAFENENGLYLEIGSGKGNFLIKQALAHKDRNFIGIEGQLSVVFRALQKIEQAELCNMRFASGFVYAPCELFAESEVSGIYLNFSDPWPKKGHSHRRLTHRNYLKQYHNILKPGGVVEIKTDNAALFEFTLEEIKETGLFDVLAATTDLHGSGFEAAKITSEYEEKFMASGLAIRYARLARIAPKYLTK